MIRGLDELNCPAILQKNDVSEYTGICPFSGVMSNVVGAAIFTHRAEIYKPPTLEIVVREIISQRCFA